MPEVKRQRTDVDEVGGFGAPTSQAKVATPPRSANSAPKLVMLLEDPAVLQPPLSLPEELVKGCLKGDVLLVCKDNKAVQCHSQILALASEVLDGMLNNTSVCVASKATTQQLHSCNGGELARIPVVEDEAELWLQALVHLYPLQLREVTPAQAVAAAVMSHKYNISRLSDVFEQWLADLQSHDPCVGRFKWVVSKFRSRYREDSIFSPSFKAGGQCWKVELNPRLTSHASQVQHLGVYLEWVPGPGFSSDQTLTAAYDIALVSQTDPVTHTHYHYCDPVVFTDDVSSGYNDFISHADLHDKSKGYIKDDCVQLHFTVTVQDDAMSASDKKRVLSTEPSDDLYIFKWLELACKVKHAVLERKCMEFLELNVCEALLHDQFREDLHAALQNLSPEQTINIMYRMC